jgi:hypothetical protein
MDLVRGATSKILSDNVLEFSTFNKKFSIIYISDAHLDSEKSKTKWLHKVLKENPDSYIVMGGDNHDLMQGKRDPRASKNALKESLKSSDYWNQVIKNSREEWVKKYKDRIICWNTGNHETSVLRNLELDFLDMLLDYGELGNRLYTRGWIIISHVYGKMKYSFPLFFQHIPPSGGQRSKGALSIDLLLADNPDARCIISEHIHTTLTHPATVERLNLLTKKLEKKLVWLVSMPTLKDEGTGKKQGFYDEKIKRGATTVGVMKLKFEFVNGDKKKYIRMLSPEPILYYDH